jgi:16S rRNA (cytidine1402-2'-O)-methyltransferase
MVSFLERVYGQGGLILIPTPLNEEGSLHPLTKACLERVLGLEKKKILVEEHKVARRRWLNSGLPRECIADFVLYNEHTRAELLHVLVAFIAQGGVCTLMSDGGLPAFCDPGQELVRGLREKKLHVSSSDFENAPILALALSGFKSETFFFAGFPPQKEPARTQWWKDVVQQNRACVIMETPYHLKKSLAEIQKHQFKRNVYLAYELQRPEESHLWGKIDSVIQQSAKLAKGEFVIVLE